MNIFTVRAYFESGVHSDFSFNDLADAARFRGEVVEAGFEASLSRSSLDKLGNQRIAFEAMHKALGVARDAAKTPA
jgi:hypothetical protein